MKRVRPLEVQTVGLVGFLLLGSFGRVDASSYIPERAPRTAMATVEPIELRDAATEAGPPITGPRLDDGFQCPLALPALPPPLTGDARPLAIPESSEAWERPQAPAFSSPRRTVPEPASLLLVVTGLIGLAARRRLLKDRH